MRHFSTNTHISKSVRSHRMHNTFSEETYDKTKSKFINCNHEALSNSYDDRFFIFYYGFGYGHVCGWTR